MCFFNYLSCQGVSRNIKWSEVTEGFLEVPGIEKNVLFNIVCN